MILSKLLLFWCFCLLLSSSLAEKLPKAKAKRLLRRALKDGEKNGGELGELRQQFANVNLKLFEATKKVDELQDFATAQGPYSRAKQNLQDAADRLKREVTIANFQKYNIAVEDYRREGVAYAAAATELADYKNRIAKLAAERQSILLQLIFKKKQKDEEEKIQRKAEQKLKNLEKKAEKAKKQHEDKEKKQSTIRLKEAKSNYAKSLFAALGIGAGATVAAFGGATVAGSGAAGEAAAGAAGGIAAEAAAEGAGVAAQSLEAEVEELNRDAEAFIRSLNRINTDSSLRLTSELSESEREAVAFNRRSFYREGVARARQLRPRLQNQLTRVGQRVSEARNTAQNARRVVERGQFGSRTARQNALSDRLEAETSLLDAEAIEERVDSNLQQISITERTFLRNLN